MGDPKANTTESSTRRKSGDAKTVTFVVTESCQLRCSYCYLVGKNDLAKMSIETGKKAVDYIIDNRAQFPEDAIIWDFIGGEPLIEIGLIDTLCDYIAQELQRKQHPWRENYSLSMTTNGLLYGRKNVQEFICKNLERLWIGLTIDGVPAKHNMHRRYPSGRGSYAKVAQNVPLWLEQFPSAGTKVTVASEDLPFIKDSVLHLFDLGIRNVNINVVFENVWRPGDDLIFEEQLCELADRMIDRGLYKTHNCSFFSEMLGYPNNSNNNWCGTGRMLAVDVNGNFFPCHRFLPFSLPNKKAICIGNCYDGIDNNKLRPFLSLDTSTQSPQECIDCDVASGCAWCQAVNYECASQETVFERATYLCKMHKARVRANNLYQHKLKTALGRAQGATFPAQASA
ncbi:MAG: radical SAM peptide maturase, CXXX-repeat target family [Beijerinckiaceae bacterium]